MKPPLLGPQTIEYRNEYHCVYRQEADFGDYKKSYYVTDYGERAGVLVLRERQVLLVRQYRLLIGRVAHEIPGGKVDAGETPAEAAARECWEETGIRCLRLEPLLQYQPGLDTLHNPTSLFVCREFRAEREPIDPEHAAEVEGHVWVPMDHCLRMVAEGQIVDSFTLIALLAYQSLPGAPGS